MSGDGAHDLQRLLAEVFERRGAEAYLGEAVTMAEHMLQAAALAEQAGADDATVVAALLHDIGHFNGEFGLDQVLLLDNRHQEHGARVLAGRLPRRVVDGVRHHVDAKRYLCATEPGYLASLSPASQRTLALQGGPMDAGECRRFAALADLDTVLAVRRWDDQAKVAGLAVAPFSHYRSRIERLLAEV